MPVTDARRAAPTGATMDVHWIALDAAWAGAAELLDEDERARAARLRFDQHRRRFVHAHAALRVILARYTGRPPSALSFVRGPQGKPALAGEPAPDVDFNLSHAHELAVLAVVRGRRVGVDLERLDGRRDTPGLVQRYFSAREREALAAVPASGAQRAFYDCWVRKEAYLKARGEGLTRSLEGFSVSVAPDDDPVSVLDEDWPDPASDWCMRPLAARSGYVAAAVASGGYFDLASFGFDPPAPG